MRSALFIALLVVAAPARAQTPPPEAPPPSTAPTLSADDEAARDHFESGRAYYQRAQYEDAAREFGEAYRLSHRAALLLNASRALEGAGRFDDAASAVQQYLDTAPPDDPDRPGAPERLARLRASADRMHTSHAGPAATTRTAPRSPPHAAPRRHGLTDIQYAGIATASASVGVAAVGLIVGLIADGIYQSLTLACPGGLCPASRQGDLDTGSAEAAASTVLFAFAIVGLCTGLALLLFGADRDAPPPAPAHHAGLGVDWSF